jgi:hypothetical protein
MFLFHGVMASSGSGPPHNWGFMITLRHTTLGRTPLDEWSARHRDLYLTTHNTHKRQASMSPAGFKPTISASEWPLTYALDCAATGIGPYKNTLHINYTVITMHSMFIAYFLLDTDHNIPQPQIKGGASPSFHLVVWILHVSGKLILVEHKMTDDVSQVRSQINLHWGD